MDLLKLDRGDADRLKGEAFIYSLCYLPTKNMAFMGEPYVSAIYLTRDINTLLDAGFWEHMGAEGEAAKNFVQHNLFGVSDFLSKINCNVELTNLVDKYAVPFTVDSRTCEAIVQTVPCDIVCAGSGSNINECHAMTAKTLMQYLQQYSEQNNLTAAGKKEKKVAVAYENLSSWLSVEPQDIKDYLLTNYLNPMLECSKRGQLNEHLALRDGLKHFFGQNSLMTYACRMANCASRTHENQEFRALMELYLDVVSNIIQKKNREADALISDIAILAVKLDF